MIELTCPKCDTEFDAIAYDTGECPNCYNSYIWEDLVAADYSESWTTVLWESNEYKY